MVDGREEENVVPVVVDMLIDEFDKLAVVNVIEEFGKLAVVNGKFVLYVPHRPQKSGQ